MSLPILETFDQEMRLSECTQTNRQTDRRTAANRFYNLSHAICYSYGADKSVINNWVSIIFYVAELGKINQIGFSTMMIYRFIVV